MNFLKLYLVHKLFVIIYDKVSLMFAVCDDVYINIKFHIHECMYVMYQTLYSTINDV